MVRLQASMSGCCSIPTAFECKKFKLILFTISRVSVSPPPLSVPITQPTFIGGHSTTVGPCYLLPKFSGKKPKATTKVTLRVIKYMLNKPPGQCCSLINLLWWKILLTWSSSLIMLASASRKLGKLISLSSPESKLLKRNGLYKTDCQQS